MTEIEGVVPVVMVFIHEGFTACCMASGVGSAIVGTRLGCATSSHELASFWCLQECPLQPACARHGDLPTVWPGAAGTSSGSYKGILPASHDKMHAYTCYGISPIWENRNEKA
ncbi:hypothetical protein HPP92_020039 [Vanilla planifolia]|uniref:Uncharacterized protein n=1 Tax=Vanilla planifolia TaxID=51239 RepID=A0A835Q0K3_VANPL|nr:hypothetical protein HPP92_020039 [Vanilla planifolia]